MTESMQVGEAAVASSEHATLPEESLRAQAYRTLCDRIVDLTYPPGHRLIERDLAVELAVSRIPLREALHTLRAEGLVVIVPRQGAIVAPFTADDVRDLFDVRESLEVLAARLAAQRATKSDLPPLRRQLELARAATAADDAAAIARANSGFHRVLIEVAANPLLKALMGPLAARVQWLFHLTSQRDPVQQCEEHEELFDAIAAHDVARAERCAYEHVHSGRAESIAMAPRWAPETVDPIAATRGRRR